MCIKEMGEIVEAKSITVKVDLVWECPYCKKENKDSWNESPYSAALDSSERLDSICKSCNKIYTIK